MSKFKGILPFIRPEITITPKKDINFDIKINETWNYCNLNIGTTRTWGIYDQPDWKLTDCCVTETLRKARVHDIDCVETKLMDFSRPDDAEPNRIYSMFIHSDEEKIQYVGQLEVRDGVFVMSTLYDEAFISKYSGEMSRDVTDSGFSVYDGTGFNEISIGSENDGVLKGIGVFEVAIGNRRFECLRVINRWQDNPRVLAENYIDREGHSILFRRYNHPVWKLEKYKQRWDEKFPEAQKLIINGEVYVHWYDCLSDIAF